MSIFGDPRTFILVLIAIGFAIQQITVGHNLDTNTALTIFIGGLGAGGVSVAHTAGVNAATGTAQTNPPPTPPAVA